MMSGGGSQQFTLRFSPQEVEDVSRTIMCHMPVLEQLAATASGAAADAFKQLTREVTGKVRAQCVYHLYHVISCSGIMRYITVCAAI